MKAATKLPTGDASIAWAPTRARVEEVIRQSAALLMSAACLWLSLYLHVWLSSNIFPVLFPAIVVGAWIGGRWGGASSTILLALGTAYFHLPPHGFAVSDPADMLRLCTFVLSGAMVAWLTGALQRSRDLTKATLLSIGDGVIATDRRGCVRVMNRVAEALTGWSNGGAKGKPLTDVFRISSTTSDPSVEKMMVQAMRERRAVTLLPDTNLLSKSGHSYPLDDSLAPIQSTSGKIIGTIVVFRDATNRKRNEAALLAAEARYREIFENAVVGMFQSTPDGRYLRVNRAMALIHGYPSPQEMMASVTDIGRQEYANPLWRDEFKHVIEEQGVVREFPLEMFRKDGSRAWALVSARVVRGERGEPIYYEGTQEDITDRKQLEKQYHHAQKMEAVGRLAGGIAHDFNNILGVISGYSDLAKAQLDPNHPAAHKLHRIKGAVERGASLTRQLLAFSRQRVVQPTVLDLNNTVHKVSEMLERLVGEDVTVSFRAGVPLEFVLADEGQIEQILMNLAVNARDAMPTGGKITIETKNVVLDEAYSQRHRPVKPGPYVMLSFADTGSGIDEGTMARIFEPFFTTKDPGKGTGLGLATVYGIVKQSNGYIWVYSEPGQGTIFKLYFPALEENRMETPSAAEAAKVDSRGGSETILLVEDDANTREMVEALLQSGGYKVLKAEHPAGALTLCQTMLGRIDLLLTDIIMPGMSGVELATRLRESRPEIKVLYMTGYAGDELRGYQQRDSRSAILEKPFTRNSLLHRVRAALDEDFRE